MRRFGLVALLAVGCSSGRDAPSRANDDDDRGDQDDGAPSEHEQSEQEQSEQGTTGTATEDTEDIPIAVDDANRFVEEDLDRFMAEHPGVLREQDEALFRTCVGAQCLDHGVSDSVTPFVGAGVRYLVPLWLRGCLSGSAKACLYAGRSYQGSQYADDGSKVHDGMTKAELQARFRRYIDRACKLDDTQCEQWADFLLGDASPSPANVELAIRHLTAGCERKEHGSCAALARHAPEHAGIDDEIGWWKKACAYDPNKPSRRCASYASLLLETGRTPDRERAVAALGPICDPSSEAWARQCKGSAANGEEACAPTYLEPQGRACMQLARSLPDHQALRLAAAMCVGSLLDEANEVGADACRRAAQLAVKLDQPASFRASIARRTCGVKEMTCLSETYDLRACDEARKACEANANP